MKKHTLRNKLRKACFLAVCSAYLVGTAAFILPIVNPPVLMRHDAPTNHEVPRTP